jgi:quercetin 2,3-dioxygenase
MTRLVTAHSQPEGAGFPIRRPFPGEVPETESDAFLLLDQVGPIEWGQGEAKGAPWHPHRGFETVADTMDGVIEHHDVTGGGGVIANGATRWSFHARGHRKEKG